MEQTNQSISPSDDQNGVNQSGDKKTNKPILIIVGIVIIVCLVICFATSLSNGGSTRTTTRATEAYDKVMLMTVTEDYVKQFLVSPSSAKFPRNQEWSITDNGSIIIVRSYVDAQNSLGAEIRSNFLARYSLPKVELQYLEVDGEVMYER